MSPRVAVIGCGYWGKNLVRVFHHLGALQLMCDVNPDRLRDLRVHYPDVGYSTSIEEALCDESVRGVVIATPAGSHFTLAREALAAGRDVFVEKPLAMSSGEGTQLVQEASAREAILMVGHILQYHPAIVSLKQIVDEGRLGDLYYLYSSRLNLGRVRQEENILWSFAPHDISVMLLLTGRLPESVAVFGGTYLQQEIADVTMSTYTFGQGVQAHIFVSWLHPFKEQRLVIVGSKQMAVFDDVATDAKLRIYDKGIAWVNGQPVPRQEASTNIQIPSTEPLDAECRHFLECIERRITPRTDGWEGLRVLQVLEASQQSLAQGRSVTLPPAGGLGGG